MDPELDPNGGGSQDWFDTNTPNYTQSPYAPPIGTPGLDYTPGSSLLGPTGSDTPPPNYSYVDPTTGQVVDTGAPQTGWTQNPGGAGGWNYYDPTATGPGGPTPAPTPTPKPAPTPTPNPNPTGGGGGTQPPGGGSVQPGYGPLNTPYAGQISPGQPNVAQFTPPPFQYADFNAPAPFKPDAPFAPPSAQSVLDNDPGYALRLNQGTQAMQQSAAARGVLNTGGTLQDLVNYGQSYAGNEYSNAYNRALGTYQTNYGNALNAYQNNYNDALNNYITGYGSALTKYNSNYGTQYQTPYNQLMGQYSNNIAAYTGAQDRTFAQQFATATA